MEFIAFYFIVGFFACITEAYLADRKRKEPVSLLVMLAPWMFLVWPVLIFVAWFEWYQPPPSEPPPHVTTPEAMGCIGTVLVDLRPSGKIQIGDKIHDARSKEFLGAGEEVVVTSSEMGSLLVERRRRR